MTVPADIVTSSGPISLAGSGAGPDLARGVMLLFIALANSHYFLDAARRSSVATRRTTDRSTGRGTWLIVTFVDGRAFPLFGLLFGYGVAQVVAASGRRGPKGVRRLLWRRAAA